MIFPKERKFILHFLNPASADNALCANGKNGAGIYGEDGAGLHFLF